jgi:hypothetical protein
MGLPRKWKTRDGTKIKIKDMSTSHIRNAISMMERNGYVSTDTLNFYVNCGEPQGDMAQMAFDQECNRIFVAPCSSTMTALERELKKREVKKKKDMSKRWPRLSKKLKQMST